MDTFVFCGEYRKRLINKPEFPVKNIYRAYPKPVGGLWSSPLLDSGKSEWEEWCEDEGYDHHSVMSGKRFSVIPKPSAKIFKISPNEVGDIECDWNDVIANYDAVLVTSDIGSLSLSGYDVTTLWVININKFKVSPM